MGHRSPHLRVLGAHFHHFKGHVHIPQAGQRAGRTRANFRVSDLAVVLQHPHWTYLMGGFWPLGRAVGRAWAYVLCTCAVYVRREAVAN
jgi:hypothetical protein